jgi:hypothetical protein
VTISTQKNQDNEMQFQLDEDIILQGEDSSKSSNGSDLYKKLYFGEDEVPKTEGEFLRFFFQS